MGVDLHLMLQAEEGQFVSGSASDAQTLAQESRKQKDQALDKQAAEYAFFLLGFVVVCCGLFVFCWFG